MSDHIQTFSFQEANLRGAIVQTSASFQDLIQQNGDQQEYPLFIKHLLGEMSTLLLMMASNVKTKGTMSLQIRGKGYLYSALVDVQLATEPLKIRGLARRADTQLPSSLDLRDWVGEQASIAITLQPEQGQPYQGLIPLDHPRLSQCIEDYYQRSEQIPTQFWTQMTDTHCAGFMLQAMPGSEQVVVTQDSIDLPTARMLANTLKPQEIIETDPNTLLHRLFHEYPVLIHETSGISHSCDCEDRMEAALLSLGLKELQSMAQEQPTIEMTCQMCGQTRTFESKAILAQLENAPDTSSKH